ncbi:transcriptional repressor CTCF [Ceratitis capitata]|uniref:C2H2-type domain-containing protein n=1 Tax=Ceratitis capitata TaxID=7213 RepID=W8CEA1_CERCA|nr:transcriptional repressor CTCF [Ceratitis capitata]
MDPIDPEDPFSITHMVGDSTEVTIEDINRLEEEDSLDEIDGPEDDLTILEIAMVKAIENVNPAFFMHLLCPRCGETFQSAPLWQQHLHNVHFFNNLKMLPGRVDEETKTYHCKKCPTSYNYLEYRKIFNHCLSHMAFNAYYKCSLCDHLECTTADMSRHIKRHMEVHMLKAKINGKMIRPKRFSLSEGIDYEKFLLYNCPECHTTFRKHDIWLEHVIDRHALFAADKLKFKTPDFEEFIVDKTHLITTCEICNATLAGDDLQQCQRKHYLTHLRNRAFRCAVCNLHFNYAKEIKMHMLLLHCQNLSTYEEAILPGNLRPKNAKFDMSFKLNPDKVAKCLPYIEIYCPICGVQLENTDDWYAHINENHDFFKAPFMALIITNFGAPTDTNRACKKRRLRPYCVVCDRVLDDCSNFTRLWAEQLRHAPFRPYTCTICHEQYHSMQTVMKHFATLHTNADGTVNTLPKQRKNGIQ